VIDDIEERYDLIEFKLGRNEINQGSAHQLNIKLPVKKNNQAEKQTILCVPGLLVRIIGVPIVCNYPE
jgi:hypothetical protein